MDINISVNLSEETDLNERIEEALEVLALGDGDPSHWKFLKGLNNYLMRKKQCGSCSPEQMKILRKIAPAINKYGRRSGDVILDEEMSKYVDTKGGYR